MGILSKLKDKFSKQESKGSYGEEVVGVSTKTYQMAKYQKPSKWQRVAEVVSKAGESVTKRIPTRADPRYQRLAKYVYPSVPKPAVKKEGRVKYGRGRPKGSYEGKYAAYGGVFGYRKFIARQKAMQNLRQQQMMQQIKQRNPQLAYQIETGQVPMPQPKQEMPQIQQQMPQQTQVSQQQYQTSQPQEFNALNVPNVLAGASLNNPAPRPSNPFQFSLGFPTERPITNPGGEWFTETDWMTGKQVLRRRSGDRMFQW